MQMGKILFINSIHKFVNECFRWCHIKHSNKVSKNADETA